MGCNAQLLEFLNQLERNNDRAWFEAHKPQFLSLEEGFKATISSIANRLNQFDIIEKYKAYRIYRDIRFSKDKTPFKPHRSAYWKRAGSQRRGGYYLKIQPGDRSYMAVGFFGPNKDDLLRIRQEFEVDGDSFKTITSDLGFQSIWGKLQGERLKTSPRNFDSAHDHIDIIRFKSFFFEHSFTDEQIQSTDFEFEIAQNFKAAMPFLNYMSEVLTTDLNGESIL
ncbi:DUF2461 domain-containing protein [Nonlabens xiamenensis]|uniref:DUF2461 domain-containing protein n=1 Tax=Nonlabens xiamenensis TaxID=2341043 RepID=UPI000F613132|nr:DUF2461 domain-containing protein [Nonlabens xiamenensis]